MPLEASYLDGLRQVAESRAPGQTLLVLFLGSTIGNFEPEAAIDFLLADPAGAATRRRPAAGHGPGEAAASR